jgi:YVTN family beta-propeller protein
MSADTFIADDADGDGVPDSVDLCPAIDASYFDRNGDGCVDSVTGARHTEYWGIADTVITYVINQTEDAAGLDQINLITLVDDEYGFGSSVLAVGISTSFTVDSLHNGRLYRPGEVVDADMIFNPTKTFTTSGGLGTDLESTAMHEAGHLYAISHSAVKSATMHYVLPGGISGRTLELDDELVYKKAYPTASTLANANRISGTVTDGSTSNPVPGAIVFVIAAVSGDTAASDYTLPDGSYTFLGLADGGYYISIFPLNGTSPINYLQPAYVNALVETTAVTLFVPEYYDAAESAFDNEFDKLAVNVSGGSRETADIITNIDVTGPSVLSISPSPGVDSVRVDAAILIQFSEAIDDGTLNSNFTLQALTGPDAPNNIGGTAVILNDDSVVAFAPTTPYKYQSMYELTLGAGLADKFGNTMTTPYVSTFETQPIPPLAIMNLAPNKGVVGNTVVINGVGFSDVANNNAVTFNGEAAVVTQASVRRLVVTVPSGATTGPVIVTTGAEISNSLTFTILSAVEIARGYQLGVSSLSGIPKSVTVTPVGDYAYVATDDGASAVVTDAGLPNYLGETPITIVGGLDELDVTPDGKRVYGVSRVTEEMHVIDSDPADGALFNNVLATIPTRALPRGIVIEPTNHYAYVSTPDSVIQKWDIDLESATYQRQVGELEVPDANVRGKMAITPAGDKLLAVSGLGNLYVFDLGPDTLLTTIAVGPNPHDVTIDLSGQRAYVSDRTGLVTVVSLDLLSYIQDINTGGSARGLTITPGGLWVYSANEQLNQIDVIDLNQNNSTFRNVAATIEQPVDPVDVEVSPDGFYAYSIVREDKQLVATAIGLGPTITSLSARAGIVGAKLVINGSGFSWGVGGNAVYFNGIAVSPDQFTGTSIIVTVPVGATSGPVQVEVTATDVMNPIPTYSNSIYYEVLGPTPPGNIRLAVKSSPPGGGGLEDALAISPLGDLALIGGDNGELFFLDIDPSSPSFNQYLGTVAVLSCCVSDVAFSPDGKMAFAVSTEDVQVPVVNTNQNSTFFGKLIGSIDQAIGSWGCPGLVKISPSGEFGIVFDPCADYFAVFDLVEGSPTYFEVTDTIPMSAVTDFEFAPDGLSAIVMETGVPGIWTLVLDPLSGNYLQLTANLPFGGTPPPFPVSAAYYPDGDSVLVYAVQTFGIDERLALKFDTSDPEIPIPIFRGVPTLPSDGGYASEIINISPRGDRAIINVTNNAFYLYNLATDPWTQVGAHGTFANLSNLDADYVPDASRYYVASAFLDSVLIYDFSTAQTMFIVSGNLQVGVVGQPLPAPLRVGVSTTSGQSLAGVPIAFEVTGGDGAFDVGLSSLVTNVVVATDAGGFAEVDFVLGSTLGSHDVEARAEGLTGSPQTFVLNAQQDPATLPLQLAQVVPLNSTPNVSVTTAIQATFSRAVDQATIADTTLYLHEQGDMTPIPVAYGFTSSDSKVSLVPISPLDYSTPHVIEFTTGIRDAAGGALTNPQSSTFATKAAPPPTLLSVAPPSALENVALVLSGEGFESVAGNNTVLFNDLAAVPTSGDVDFLSVKVPSGAATGAIRVATATDTSNALPFYVLVQSSTTVDEVIRSVNAGGSTNTVTITPDGSIAYSVSPEADLVIPIGVDSLVTYPSISVGDYPVAIVINPAGTNAYVANFLSAGLSIIDTDQASPGFNSVDTTLVVGSNPSDVAVLPDGSRVYVANSGSGTLSVVDGDSSSATHNTVIRSVNAGGSANTVTVSPDGSRIYIGTDTGITVLESLGYGVIRTANTGGSAQSTTISPDGTLLFVVTTEGDVLIIDVEPGSATEFTVIRSVNTGGTTTTVTVSPDGSLVYLVQGDSDTVIVMEVETIGSVSVLDNQVVLPPKNVNVAFVDTILTNNNPEALAMDPTGSGRFVIATSGDGLLTIYGEASEQFAADIRVTPRTLNLQSRGRFVTGLIELPVSAPIDVYDIDVGSVLLQDTISVVPGSAEFGDEDGDGAEDLVVKFDRSEFQAVIPQGEFVEVTISGEAGIHTFMGLDTIRTLRPTVMFPRGGEVLAVSSIVDIRWTSPSGVQVDYVDVHFSDDDGASWSAISERVTDTGTATWAIPATGSEECRIMVTLYRNEEPIGMGMSPETFVVGMPVAVTVTGFEGSIEDGDAVLRWTTGLELKTAGFHLLRSESKEDVYETVTNEMVPAKGGTDGSSYEYRDESVRPNRRYFYKLQELVNVGIGSEYGPYEVSYKLSYELEQNVPNPFNPTTTIRFSIAADSHVRLIVYDVAGRRVRTLVDGNRRADMYKVDWDGRNDSGQQVATGVYFYRITAGKFTHTRKMLLLK